MKNPMKFIQEVKQEAFKVSWPTWKETLQGALMVFAMAVVQVSPLSSEISMKYPVIAAPPVFDGDTQDKMTATAV